MKNSIILSFIFLVNLSAQNWLSLDLENEWLFLKLRSNWNHSFNQHSLVNIKVIDDSVINGKTYYRLINFFDYYSASSLFRYDEGEHIIYGNISGNEGIVIDFDTPVSSTFNQISPTGQNRFAKILEMNLNILDTIYFAKGFSASSSKMYFVQDIGIGFLWHYESAFDPLINESSLIDYNVAGATPNRYKPKSNITLHLYPIGSTIYHNNIYGNVNVTHPYSKGAPGDPYSTNFVDTCWIEWFYQKEDSVCNLRKEKCTIRNNFQIDCNSSTFDFELLENGFKIFYRIVIRNKYFENNLEYAPPNMYIPLSFPDKKFTYYNNGNYWKFDEYYKSTGSYDSTYLGTYTYLIEKDTILVNNKTYHKIITKNNLVEFIRNPINDSRLIRTDGITNEHVIDDENLSLFDSLQSSRYGRNHPVIFYKRGFNNSYMINSGFRVFASLMLPNSNYVVKDSIGLIYMKQAINIPPYDEFKTTILREAYIDGKMYYNVPSSVVENENPRNFILHQNYPNPFNPTTTIKYAVANTQQVQLKIYDVLGEEIATLVNEEKAPGEYEVEFAAAGISSGIYFYQLRAGTFSETKKLVLLR